MQESFCLQNHTSLCDGFNILNLSMCDGDFPWMRKNVLYITVMYLLCWKCKCVPVNVHAPFGLSIHHFLRDFCCSLLWLLEYLLKIKQKNLTPTVCSYWHTIILCCYMVYIALWMTPQYYSLNIHPLDLLFLCSTALLITI